MDVGNFTETESATGGEDGSDGNDGLNINGADDLLLDGADDDLFMNETSTRYLWNCFYTTNGLTENWIDMIRTRVIGIIYCLFCFDLHYLATRSQLTAGSCRRVQIMRKAKILSPTTLKITITNVSIKLFH